MAKMFSKKEIIRAAGALGNQMIAGLPMDVAVREMIHIQPERSEFWAKTLQIISDGDNLSLAFKNGVWPENLISVIEAGEKTSGKLGDIFLQIEKTLEIENDINQYLIKVTYPILIVVFGICSCLILFLFTVPNLKKLVGGGRKIDSFLIDVSDFLVDLLLKTVDPILIVSGIISIFVLIIILFKDPSNRNLFQRRIMESPLLIDATGKIAFGIWAHYVSMAYAAGISTISTLKITKTVLLPDQQNGVDSMLFDLITRSFLLSDTMIVENMDSNDPRRSWPHYIRNAFQISGKTGNLDLEMGRVAPVLIKEGIKAIQIKIAIANFIAMIVSAVIIAFPVVGYVLVMREIMNVSGF